MTERLPVDLLLALLFNLMGPVAIMARFAAVTGHLDDAGRRRTALVAAATSLLALALAIALGSSMLTRFQIDRGSMVLAAGAVLLLASLRAIHPPASPPQAPAHSPARGGISPAISPIAVPGNVTPAAVGLLIIFASAFTSMEARLMIFLAVAAIMVLNYAAMIYAHAFLAAVGVAPLVVLGAVFGILQVALAIQMISSGLKMSFFQ